MPMGNEHRPNANEELPDRTPVERWFVTNDESWGRAIWRGTVPPRWIYSAHTFRVPDSENLTEVCRLVASENVGEKWLIDIVWPETLRLRCGDMAEIFRPCSLVVVPWSLVVVPANPERTSEQ